MPFHVKVGAATLVGPLGPARDPGRPGHRRVDAEGARLALAAAGVAGVVVGAHVPAQVGVLGQRLRPDPRVAGGGVLERAGAVRHPRDGPVGARDADHHLVAVEARGLAARRRAPDEGGLGRDDRPGARGTHRAGARPGRVEVEGGRRLDAAEVAGPVAGPALAALAGALGGDGLVGRARRDARPPVAAGPDDGEAAVPAVVAVRAGRRQPDVDPRRRAVDRQRHRADSPRGLVRPGRSSTGPPSPGTCSCPPRAAASRPTRARPEGLVAALSPPSYPSILKPGSGCEAPQEKVAAPAVGRARGVRVDVRRGRAPRGRTARRPAAGPRPRRRAAAIGGRMKSGRPR